MNKHITTQILAAMMACAVTAALPACGGSGDIEPVTGSAASPQTEIVTEAAEETSDPGFIDDLDQRYDFGGRDFHFLTFGNGDPYSWSEIDVIVEGETGETINDGIYRRNLVLEDRLNIKIASTWSMNSATDIVKSVSAGDSTYDAVWMRISGSGPSAQKGALLDWRDVPNVDMSKKYWDSSMMRDLSIGGRVYFMTGDISTIDNQATWTGMFNKDMIKNYGLESPYDLVYKGQWTIDRFAEMSKNVSRDLDGDGKYTSHDMYGLSTTFDTVYGLFYSCGLTFIGKTDDDLPVFALDQDKAQTVLEKTCEIFNRDNTTLCSGRITGDSDVITTIRNAFNENRALFYCEVMFHVANLRQMENDFGIIPMPKYNEEQNDYITFVNPAGSCLGVPITTPSADETGIVLEAMASASKEFLTAAYYETALKGKYARDEESAEMLDILLNNRVYDLAMIYGWGSIQSDYNSLVQKDNTDLASAVAKKADKIESAIDKFVSEFDF